MILLRSSNNSWSTRACLYELLSLTNKFILSFNASIVFLVPLSYEISPLNATIKSMHRWYSLEIEPSTKNKWCSTILPTEPRDHVCNVGSYPSLTNLVPHKERTINHITFVVRIINFKFLSTELRFNQMCKHELFSLNTKAKRFLAKIIIYLCMCSTIQQPMLLQMENSTTHCVHAWNYLEVTHHYYINDRW